MAQKNYVSLNRLSDFLDNLKNKFAAISHGHTIAEIADYEVDDALSSTSANPVQNKVINDEFEAVATAMNALDLAIDGKTDEAYVDAKVDASIAEVKTDSSNKDAVVLYEAQAYTDAAIANSISQPIIDVLTLPTDNIDTNAFYRSKTANFVANNEIQNGNTTIIYVDALPETGLPAVDLDAGDLRWYYNTSDGVVYGYIDETMSEMASSEGMTVPVGWYPFNTLYEMTGVYCDMAIILVYALPEQGLPALDLNNEGMCLYYNASDNIVYSYITNTLSEVLASEFDMTVPSGWYPFDNFTDLLGVNYGGVITSMGDAVDANAGYILVSSAIYCYNNQWEPLKEEQELIQPDWNQSDNTQPDYIWNKPNVAQADWNIADQSNPAAIKNRPFGDILAGSVIYEGVANLTTNDYGGYLVSEGKCSPTFEVVKGAVYEVICNGVSYGTGTATKENYLDFGMGGYIIPSTGQMVQVGTSGTMQLVCVSGATKTLNSKYLPIENEIMESSTNPISSGAVYTEIDSISTSIRNLKDVAPPTATTEDNNKVLTVVNGEASWETQTNELPSATTEDNGKVLTTIDGSPVWEEPNSVDILVYDDGDGNISINLDDENNQIVNFKPNQTMNNLVETNSTFKDGITDWQFYNQTEENGYTTVEPEGICWHFITFDKPYYYLRHRIATSNVIVGHKYYFSSRLKYEGTAPITPYVAFGNLGGVITVSETAPKKIFEWTYVSSIKEPTTADAPYGLHYLIDLSYNDSLTCNPDTKVYFSNAICIDLTEVFGEGNEPDIATMDKLIQKQYPYGFDGAAPLYITDNGANSHQMKTLTLGRTKYEFLPKATDVDEGKLLQIAGGVPAWVSITNGNEVAY